MSTTDEVPTADLSIGPGAPSAALTMCWSTDTGHNHPGGPPSPADCRNQHWYGGQMPADSIADVRGRSTPDPAVTACSVELDLYLHPLLEDPPVQYTADKETWATYQQLVERARSACAACPLLVECLYKAVVQSDISGYVGCTTPKERGKIRRQLGVKVDAEDLDAAAGARGNRRPVDHDDVTRARAAYPDDSLESLAQRLDCSLSTVKRHLRRARSGSARPEPPAPPTVEDVLDAFDHVVEVRTSGRAPGRPRRRPGSR